MVQFNEMRKQICPVLLTWPATVLYIYISFIYPRILADIAQEMNSWAKIIFFQNGEQCC